MVSSTIQLETGPQRASRFASRLPALLLAACAALCACSRKPLEVPELSDPPVLAPARRGEIRLTAPAYGIALNRGGRVQFEVNLEAGDAPRVREGDACVAYAPPSTATVSCAVTRVLRGVSEETGQAIAWLSPRAGASLPTGEFVFAMITTQVKKRALVVPQASVLTKDGKSWVIVRRRGEKGAAYEPAEVEVGDSGVGVVEVSKGLTPGTEVVVQGGIGYLYPEFKAAGD